MKHLLKLALFAALLTGVSCTRIGLGEDTSSPVNAAFQVSVSNLSVNGATVAFVTEQDNIATYKMVGPVPGLQLNYLALDPIERKAYIEENGREIPAGEAQALTGLKAGTNYVVGAIGYDAAGGFVTAPTFRSFTTKNLSVALAAEVVTEEPGNYEAKAVLTVDEYTASYNYVFDQEHASLTDDELLALLKSKGTGVQTGKGSANLSFKGTTADPVVCAVLAFDQAGDPAPLMKVKLNFASAIDGNKAYWVMNEQNEEMTEVSTGVFEFTKDVQAGDTFTIMYHKVQYGFISYSGNGGVGRVEHLKAAVPFYNIPAGTASPYYVEKAVGRMALMEDGANAFWVNVDNPGPLKVRADFTKDVPRYYLEYQAPADPSIVLKQNFDLFVWGADYSVPIAGSGVGGATIGSDQAINYDGTEAATPNTVKTTAAGVDPVGHWGPDTLYPCSEDYVKNRDLVGWTFGYLAELAGQVRLSKGTLGWQGWLITPKLPVAANTTVTLSFDCARFGPYAVDFPVSVLGGGTFKSGKVDAKGDGFVDVTVSGTLYNITATDCPPYANTDPNKPWSHVVLTIEGAGPDTQIMWDARPITSSKSDIRLRLDNILITQ